MENNEPTNTNNTPAIGYNRRRFMEDAGIGILAATVIGELASCSSSAQSVNGGKSLADTISVNLPPRDALSEQKLSGPPALLPPQKRIGFAIVGLGDLALNQIMPAFGSSKYAKPVALVSGHPDKAQKVAAQYGIAPKNIYSYQNFDQIKNNPDIDAVYIVLPNSMHEEFTIRAAKAGKHVLCEKPMANSAEQARRMIKACKDAGKKLMIAYRIQYEPHNRLAMKWARDKHFGRVKIIELANTQNAGAPGQWRLKKALAGGGSLPDIGLYCLNTSRFILGEEPEMVMATVYSTPGDPRFKEVEESVLWQMHFPSGALVNATTSYGTHKSRRYRCYADNGGWFGLDPAFDYQRLQIEASQAQGNLEVKQSPDMGEKDQFTLELDHMAQCILENKTPYTPGEEGLQDHIIMEAIYESARTGKPVKLNKIDKPDAFRGSAPKDEF
ncbi:Gfo/Idh/MocA family protein [Mucilaginibacter phyllosphaerae]|uniref:Dehydrogenase n=1 Tax=Mucilaginibacter phyllosphaerae TaxID=1812349 RepID=A0A4Y8A779_9SPHI|nr:Gfo/Idh/MocA family oxidoreductase [Mucilaginibacter phyllosphaerae]MBB3970848.1 putative dehydrogenase [Mucilaginibacter phyllosphaerae]TEW64216.1 Gfo/Idh/MocA family oxidoreductase [Mucilaginibacter phyllosphaerae]GGH04980.1 glucose-fructose oxidoreductase [Mucilaginibacter phyllosphaerae]